MRMFIHFEMVTFSKIFEDFVILLDDFHLLLRLKVLFKIRNVLYLIGSSMSHINVDINSKIVDLDYFFQIKSK